jgi:tricorn protease-like protein
MVLVGPAHEVRSLAFSPDGTKLYAAHGFVGVHVWDLATRRVTPLNNAEGVRVFGEFVPHPDGRWAFGRCPHKNSWNANDAYAIDLKTGRTRPSNYIGVVGQDVAVSPSGRHVITIGFSQYDKDRPSKKSVLRLYGWTMTAAGPKYAWHRDTPEKAEAHAVVYLGEERLVTVENVHVAGPPVLGLPAREHRLTVRSAADGKPQAALACPQPHLEQILASPDGNYVVARRGTALWVWQADDWQRPVAVVKGTHGRRMEPRAAAFHPSGRYLFLAVNGPSVAVLAVPGWKMVRKWKWDVGVLRAVAVSADGSLAAAAGPRGTVVVWDLDL